MSDEEELTVGDIWDRQGKILISRDVMKDSMLFVMEEIMSKIIVLRCEHLAMDDRFEYYAISKEFDPIPKGEIPPYYDVEIDTEEEEITFEKREDQELW